MTDMPALAMETAVDVGRRPPPYFVPVEAPPCGHEIEGPSLGGIFPRFVCDRVRGHEHDGHRQVVYAEDGMFVSWTEEWIQLNTPNAALPFTRRRRAR